MENVILIIHLLLALSLIGLILLQRSEGGGLGIGGGGGGLGSLATVGQTASALTRATAICAALFFATSIILAILAGTHHKSGVLDSLDSVAPAVQVEGAAEAGGDGLSEKVDSKAADSDKEAPKAPDEPAPQSGAPSAPISQ